MAVHRVPSSKWLFTREQLENTPSRCCGVEADRELSYRQQAANLIQDIGQRLNVSQLIINTAIVYMHRFYMIHSFTKFHRNVISQTTLFLAAKVEEQPRKLEHVIKIAHTCMNPQESALDTKSNAFLQLSQELVGLETIVLQTLGFEITVDHPHTDVVKCSQLVRASKDLAQTSYFMATNSLHLTTFCLQHRPTVVACVCIHLACKWSNWEIPVSIDGKHWWEYVDCSVTLQQLDELTHEFLQILEKTPSRLKRIRNWRAIQAAKKPKTEGAVVDITSDGLGPAVSSCSSFFPSTSGSSDSSDLVSLAYASFEQPQLSDFAVVKHKHKGAAAFSRSHQVLSLDKYREKYGGDAASHNGTKEDLSMDTSSSHNHHYHKKHTASQQGGQSGGSRREKSTSKKSRAPPSGVENTSAAGEELKMRIKVSSERHRAVGHRHGKHAKGTAPGSHGNDAASSSRKRPHSDHAHNHHSTNKSGKSFKLSSTHFPSEGVAKMTELHNGTDYKDTFDMLDSLLSAQGMNL